MKVLVTGSNGFVGSSLCKSLAEKGYKVKAAMRTKADLFEAYPNVEVCLINEIDETDWRSLLNDVDVIISLAARVHQVNDKAVNSMLEYHRVNVLGTEKILDAAIDAGVKRFVFLSTIKVNGEESCLSGFTELDEPKPQDSYAISKWQAEQLIYKKTQGTNLDWVILRTPLVYGKGVRANFASLIKLVSLNLPLPLALVRNKRSFIFIENLISALLLVSVHPDAKGKTYLVADSEAPSTAELIRAMALVLGRRAFLLPIPPFMLKSLAKFFGKEAIAQRLLGNLVVNASLIKSELAWAPEVSLTQALEKVLDK